MEVLREALALIWDRFAQKALDAAVLKQALEDLQGKGPRKESLLEAEEAFLDAAEWLGGAWEAHVFSLERVCERLGLSERKVREKAFLGLPPSRQDFLRFQGLWPRELRGETPHVD